MALCTEANHRVCRDSHIPYFDRIFFLQSYKIILNVLLKFVHWLHQYGMGSRPAL